MYNVNEAYKNCEKVIANHSKSFYRVFSLLPKSERNAVWAVYTFCRRLDDLIDEGNDPEAKLAQFTLEFQSFLEGKYDSKNFIWVALHDVFRRFDMDKQAFHDLMKGQKMDLTINRYETVDQLLNYCYHVASTVGLILLPILAPKDTALLAEGAVALGIAMQLTNILRDVGEDLERNRIYLPREVMKKYKLTEDSLMSNRVELPFINVVEHLAALAEKLYEQAFQTMDKYPINSRLSVKAAAYLYREIIPTIRLKNYNVFIQKHFVTDEKKQYILANM